MAVVLALAITAAAVATGRRNRQRDRQLLDYDVRVRGGGTAPIAFNDAYRPRAPSGGANPNGEDEQGNGHQYGALGNRGSDRGGPCVKAGMEGGYAVLQPAPQYEVSDYDGGVRHPPHTDADGYEVPRGCDDAGSYTATIANDGVGGSLASSPVAAITVVYAGHEYAIPVDAAATEA